jgi:hypothetical protein
LSRPLSFSFLVSRVASKPEKLLLDASAGSNLHLNSLISYE